MVRESFGLCGLGGAAAELDVGRTIGLETSKSGSTNLIRRAETFSSSSRVSIIGEAGTLKLMRGVGA